MIEIQTGNIIFPELNRTISPLLHYSDFISVFPTDHILQIRDMKNGYIWYDMRETIYDNKIPVYLCFNPQKALEFVNLYPQSFDINVIRHWEEWSPEEVEKDKKYCDEWLVKFCGLQNEENFFHGVLFHLILTRDRAAAVSRFTTQTELICNSSFD